MNNCNVHVDAVAVSAAAAAAVVVYTCLYLLLLFIIYFQCLIFFRPFTVHSFAYGSIVTHFYVIARHEN